MLAVRNIKLDCLWSEAFKLGRMAISSLIIALAKI